MGKVIFFIFFIFFIIMVFVPNMILIDNNNDIELMKQNLNLSARALINAVDKNISNVNEIAEGYDKGFYFDINVDNERLLKEFYDVLRKNVVDTEEYEAAKNSIKLKIVVYNDKFFVANERDLWSPPFFFTLQHEGIEYYLNSKDNKAYYYDDTGNKISDVNISDLGISLKEKNDIIINKINQMVGQLTYETGLRDGITIRIFNKDNNDKNYISENCHFNILDGLTFFVVYASNKHMLFYGKKLNYKNYNVAGYTLEDI